MYGAWHVHFESPNDTGNVLDEMLDEFESVGAKKVTVTEHDVFTSFVELKDKCRDRSVKVIPGVEGTMTDVIDGFPLHNAHMVLVAKDKVGYRSLSKIITDANKHFSLHSEDKRPIITWENLEKNVAKGHIFMSSACIQGIFGQIVKSPDITKQELTKKAERKLGLTAEEVEHILAVESELSEKKKAKTITADETKVYKDNHKLYLHYKRYKTEIEKVNEIPVLSKERILELCSKAYDKLCSIFGKDFVYFELQNHGLPSEKQIYSTIARLPQVHMDNVLLTNDIHVGKVHPTETDFLRRNVAQYSRYHTVWEITDADKELYIKDDEDLMNAVRELPSLPDGIVECGMENVKKVLSSCETDYLYEKSEGHYPKFSDHAEDDLKACVEIGKKERFPNGFPSKEYDERLKHELDVICGMGYADYHLIVQDYVNWTKKYGYCVDFFRDHEIDFTSDLTNQTICLDNSSMTYQGVVPTMAELDETIEKFHIPEQGINMGPGRGSAVSSLVCYLLGISDIDPVRYHLLFERFLNPERKSMPDIDCDFRPDLRGKAIEYTKMKYGENSTCKIITKTYGALAGNIRLAARYLGTKEYDKLPLIKQMEIKESTFLKPWYNAADRLSKSIDKDGNITDTGSFNKMEQEIFDLAESLSGLFLSFGQHAGGNIISRDDITDSMPLFWNSKKQNFSTQCVHDEAEQAGFLKMDFLGLINLNLLTDMMELTGDNSLMDREKREKILNDPKIYQEIFSTGNTQGVFQFESNGMKELMREFQPDCFEDLILLVALYRPGPLQYKDEIVATKWYRKGQGKKPTKAIDINNDVLNRILEPTYGCIIYQEQVMQIFEFLAGYSLGDADLVRRAMAKKNLDKLTIEREAFLHGDKSRNIKGVQATFGLSDNDLAPYNALFDQMLDFASYAFNKSHAAAYSLVSFFTAYFKCYHPGEFYAVSLNHTGTLDEVAPFVSEMRTLNSTRITLKRPDVRYATPDFKFDGKDILYGYTHIKGMSKDVKIQGGDYPTLKAFWEKNPLTLPVLETLTNAGFFRHFGSRQSVIEYFEQEVPNALKRKKILDSAENGVPTDAQAKKLEKIPEMSEFVGRPSEPLRSKDSELKTEGRSSEEPLLELYGNEYQSMGLVFPDDSIWRRLALTDGFPKEGKARVGAVVCFVNKDRPVKSKGRFYYETYLMDKTGEIRKFFSDEVMDKPYGLFDLTPSPWCMAWGNTRKGELPTESVLIFNGNVGSTGYITRGEMTDLLCKIKSKELQVFHGTVLLEPFRGMDPIHSISRYLVMYGNESIRESTGIYLSSVEYHALENTLSEQQKTTGIEPERIMRISKCCF